MDASTLVIIALALLLSGLAYLKSPELPLLGLKTSGQLLWFVLPRTVAALGAALGPLVAYLTSWSLFGFQRIIVWEYPLMGGRFVLIRLASGFFLPVIAGLAAQLFARE